MLAKVLCKGKKRAYVPKPPCSGHSVLIFLRAVIVFNGFLFRASRFSSLQEEKEIILYIMRLSEAYMLHHLRAGNK